MRYFVALAQRIEQRASNSLVGSSNPPRHDLRISLIYESKSLFPLGTVSTCSSMDGVMGFEPVGCRFEPYQVYSRAV
jgi:hypothetical protein